MAVFAVYEGDDARPHVQPNTRYPVEEEDKFGFWITVECEGEKHRLFCLWTGCAHLNSGDWTRVEEPSDES
jgi:hypothetical protein